MKYLLYRFAGHPPATPPVGMNELLGIRELSYPPARAMAHMLSIRVGVPPEEMRTFNTQQPVTHLGLYNFHTDQLLLVKEVRHATVSQ